MSVVGVTVMARDDVCVFVARSCSMVVAIFSRLF